MGLCFCDVDLNGENRMGLLGFLIIMIRFVFTWRASNKDIGWNGNHLNALLFIFGHHKLFHQ